VVFRLQIAGSTIFRKTQPGIQDYIERNCHINPETVMDWKREELPKMIDGYQPKEIKMLTKLDCSITSSPV